MNTFWRNFINGVSTIFEGMATINLFPAPLTSRSKFAKYKSMTPKEAYEADAAAIRGDWEKVMGDFNRAVKKFHEEIE